MMHVCKGCMATKLQGSQVMSFSGMTTPFVRLSLGSLPHCCVCLKITDLVAINDVRRTDAAPLKVPVLSPEFFAYVERLTDISPVRL